MASKYRNIRVSIDGILFDSKAEAKRYGELKLLERAGEINGIAVHQRFPLIVNGVKVSIYESDFTYTTSHGAFVVEDVKGMKTAVYKLKRKLFEATTPFKITEIAA